MGFTEFGHGEPRVVEEPANKAHLEVNIYNLCDYFGGSLDIPDILYEDRDGRIQALRDGRIFSSHERSPRRWADVEKRTVHFGENESEPVFFERPVHPDACANIATYLSAELSKNPKINTVVFLDTVLTELFLNLVKELHENGYIVIIRDHHTHGGDIDRDLVARFQEYIDSRSILTTRQEAPGCAQLVKVGEFSAENFIVIADNDKDGLLTAMKAKGIEYEGMTEDCDILDGNPAEQDPDKLTAWGKRLLMLTETMPRTRKDLDQDKEKFRRFSIFIRAVQGDEEALKFIDGEIQNQWEATRVQSERLVSQATKVCNQVFLVDMTLAENNGVTYDQGTLFRGCIARGTRVLVIKNTDRSNSSEYTFMMIDGDESLFHIVMTPAAAEKLNEKVEKDIAKKREKTPDPQRNKHILMLQPFKGFCKGNIWAKKVLPRLRDHYGA